MLYSETIRSEKSKFLLRAGEAIWYSWYQYPNGARWIVRYKGKFYKIVHDGTGNQFYHSHEPQEISEEEAKSILSNYKEAWEDAVKLWGWESLDEYFAKTL
jgi:hypothetical protein